MSMHRSLSTTTMSTYGINYFNDACSSGDFSDGYQSSISPITSPALGTNNYNNYDGSAATFLPKKTHSYQNDCCFYSQTASNLTETSYSFKKSSNQVDYESPNTSYRLNVQIKPYTKTNDSQIISKALAPEKQLEKVNRFVRQFNLRHENSDEKLIEKQESQEPNQPPEILKKRRFQANARERRRMNNLNFAFDR